MPSQRGPAITVLSEFMLFHNTLEPIKCYNAREIETDKFCLESFVGGLINTYCKTHRDIAGYQQIAVFHNNLVNNAKIPDIEIVDIQPPKGQNRSIPITNAFDSLCGYLKQDGKDVYASFGFLFNEHSLITEYMVFRIKNITHHN